MSSNKSIANKIILIITSVSAIIILITLPLSMIRLYNKLKFTVGEDCKEVARKTSENLKVPMWNYDNESTKNIILQEIKNSYIYAIIIKDKNNVILSGLYKDDNKIKDLTKIHFIKEKYIHKKITCNIVKDEDHIGVLEIYIDRNYIKKILFEAMIDQLLQTLFFIMIVCVCVYIFIKRSLIKAINEVVATFKNISTGKGDLTVKIQNIHNDEIGELSSYFNCFIEYLSNMIKKIRNVTGQNSLVSQNLARSSEETFVSLEEIRKNIQNMRDKINLLDTEIVNLNNNTNNVNKFVLNVNNIISTQANSITQSSSAIEEMASSIKNVSSITDIRINLINKLEKMSIEGEDTMIETKDAIIDVAKHTNSIQELLNVINNIASQTNLLAMNAAIESAHAGEYGKGFSVVSDEIRKLAENTSFHSKEISNSLKDIIKSISMLTSKVELSGDYFKKIVTDIKEISSSFLEVKTAMGELNVGSNQILNSLKNLNKVSGELENLSSKMTDNINNISVSVNTISMISNDNTNGMEEVNIGINEIFKAIGTISEEGNKNVENTSEIEKLICEFKTA